VRRYTSFVGLLLMFIVINREEIMGHHLVTKIWIFGSQMLY